MISALFIWQPYTSESCILEHHSTYKHTLRHSCSICSSYESDNCVQYNPILWNILLIWIWNPVWNYKQLHDSLSQRQANFKHTTWQLQIGSISSILNPWNDKLRQGKETGIYWNLKSSAHCIYLLEISTSECIKWDAKLHKETELSVKYNYAVHTR